MRHRVLFFLSGLALSSAPSLIGADASSSPAPTFNRDVAPILYKNCSGCHRPGEVAPFSLLSYDDAAKRAKQLAAVTQSRYMPPWKAEPGYGKFMNERRLTAQQIATIKDWAEHGAPEGSPAEKPEPPKFTDGWQAGQPDQVATMTQPFSLPAEGADVFRCFVIPLDAKEDEYVNQVEFRPGNRKVVHHAILYLDANGRARKRETVPGQGYDCPGGPGLSISGGLGGWAPGATPARLRDGLAITVRKGADMVMQLHYHLSGKPETDRSSVGITFTKTPPVHGLTAMIIGNIGIDIAPGDGHYVIQASGTLPMDAEVIGIFPHGHYLCKDMKVDATLPDGAVEPLIWIKDWDFNWQGSYRYAIPVKLPKGTRIDMQYIYDNSAANPRNPNNPPKRVIYGEQTTNEMGFTFLQLTLDDPASVSDFQRDVSAQFIASMVEVDTDTGGLGRPQSAGLKYLRQMFDKNHDGRLDEDERRALIEYLRKQAPAI